MVFLAYGRTAQKKSLNSPEFLPRHHIQYNNILKGDRFSLCLSLLSLALSLPLFPSPSLHSELTYWETLPRIVNRNHLFFGSFWPR